VIIRESLLRYTNLEKMITEVLLFFGVLAFIESLKRPQEFYPVVTLVVILGVISNCVEGLFKW
jgi:hypothetical protein